MKTIREFEGKNVLITGACGGLGTTLCSHFAAHGAHIIAIDKDQQKLVELETELQKLGTTTTIIPCDLSELDQIKQKVHEVIGEDPEIDILIHNAGITHRSAFRDTEFHVIKKVIDVNQIGPIYLTKLVLESLIKAKGLIIVISSVAGIAPLIGRTGYSSSKHALHGFFESLRTEIEPLGVSVLIVCPSFIQTGIEKNALNETGGKVTHAQVRMGKVFLPNDIAVQIIQGAKKRKHILLPGKISKTAYIVSRLFPKFYANIMSRKFLGEIRK